ncbi:hypothetical protein KA107_03770 [Candidatus Pacearchaeota archaeon]|nr:hypothetical protein [Candidatus Pacearchaeota archaeon]
MLKEILLLFIAILLGILGAYITNYERKIYGLYFPPILWALAIISAIYYSIDIRIALTTTFMFIMILAWKYSTKLFKKEK